MFHTLTNGDAYLQLEEIRSFRIPASQEDMRRKHSCAFPLVQETVLLRFSSVIRIRGINPYIHVDRMRARRIRQNWCKPLPVLVRINGQPKKPWHINMIPVGDGSFYLYLREIVRKASGTKVGDRVRVELSFDETYRGGPAHPLPSWFSVALEANPRARMAWNDLTPSRKKEVLRYFLALKSPEAKARNLRKIMDALFGREVRFMARTWGGGK